MYKLPEKSTTKEIALAHISKDANLQQRSGKRDDEYLIEMSDVLREAQTTDAINHIFPPVGVVWDGKVFHLFDGYYRTSAYEGNNIPAIEADIYIGNYDDAVILSYGANPAHGLRRSSADKRKAVTNALSNPLLADYTKPELAALCGVSREYVYKIEKQIADQPRLPQTTSLSPAEEEQQQQVTESDIEADVKAEESGNEAEAWISKIPALNFIQLHYGEISPEALEMAKTWRALGAVGLWSWLRSKKSVLKTIELQNPVIDAFHRLEDIPAPESWGVCPACRGAGVEDESTYQVCGKCCGGVVLTGGLTP